MDKMDAIKNLIAQLPDDKGVLAGTKMAGQILLKLNSNTLRNTDELKECVLYAYEILKDRNDLGMTAGFFVSFFICVPREFQAFLLKEFDDCLNPKETHSS
jgi:hypothetical protein